MNTVCEKCGKTSSNDKVCSHCGAEIVSEDKVAKLPSNLMWGWATFDFSSLDSDTQLPALDKMREHLTVLERFSLLHLINSQLDKINTDQPTIKLLLRDDYCCELASKLQNEFSTMVVYFDAMGYFSYASELNERLKTC